MRGNCPDLMKNKGFPKTKVKVASLREPLIGLLVTKLDLHREDAAITVDHLIRAEQAGKSDHGLIRISYLVSSGKFGPYSGVAPFPQRLGPGRFHADGKGHLGYPTLHKLVEACQRELENQEVCIGTSANLYPSGMLGDWARIACENGAATILVASSPPRMAAPGGSKPVLGTNPICIGIPTQPVPFISDCATSEITHGMLLLARASGKPLPTQAAVGKDGEPTVLADDLDPARGKGALLPFGGSHKAFALAMGIELLVSLGGCPPGGLAHGSHGVFGLFLSRKVLEDVLPAMSDWLQRLDEEEVRIPGWKSQSLGRQQSEDGNVEVLTETFNQIKSYIT